jgi:phenylalanyl-tRNA synthetase alpha chain
MGIAGECGIPEDVNVIAWGLSLERPTMILYGVDNIRDLFGTKVNLSMIRANPVCRLGMDEPVEDDDAEMADA